MGTFLWIGRVIALCYTAFDMVRASVFNSVPVSPLATLASLVPSAVNSHTVRRFAVYEVTGKRDRDDNTHKVTSILDGDYCEALLEHEYVIPMGDAISSHDTDATLLKMRVDEIFCNKRRIGKESEPNWTHCVHADSTRACDFLLCATQDDDDLYYQVEVSVAVIAQMKLYASEVPEYKETFENVFNWLQLSDTMQKYIACIVLGKDFSPFELATMVRTTVNRNTKWSGDLSRSVALLILLPLLKELFKDKSGSLAEREDMVEQLYEDYHNQLEKFDLKVRMYNPNWVDVVCNLAECFGVPCGPVLDELRSDLSDLKHAAEGSKLKIRVPSDEISWVSDQADDMRIVKVGDGIRADGLHNLTKCCFTMQPPDNVYQLVFKGRGAISVGSGPDEVKLRTSSPIVITKVFEVYEVRQNDAICALICDSLTLNFYGGQIVMVPDVRS